VAYTTQFGQGEICRNGIDDNGNGKADEEPYCTTTSDSVQKCNKDGKTTIAYKNGREIKIPPCEIILTPEKAQLPVHDIP